MTVRSNYRQSACDFCKGQPVINAAAWNDGKPRPPAACPRCGVATPAELECLDGPGGCVGQVKPRWPGYGETLWPRCKRHGDERIEREQENIRRNSPDGPGAPRGFDLLDADETWDNEAA